MTHITRMQQIATQSVLQMSHEGSVCVFVCQTAEPSSADLSDWRSVEAKRLELLSAVCKNSTLRNLTHTSINKFVLDRIFVCDKHKILFCQTPKVGNTQWTKVLIVLNGECLLSWCDTA